MICLSIVILLQHFRIDSEANFQIISGVFTRCHSKWQKGTQKTFLDVNDHFKPIHLLNILVAQKNSSF